MKVLVTGGCGFLGSNLAAFYIENGVEVVVIDALFRKGSQQNLNWLKNKAKPKQFWFYNFDIAERAAVDVVFQAHGPFDYICHFAGQVAMTTSINDPHRDLMTNAVGTVNVLEAARKYSSKALMAYSSTNKVYGDLNHLIVDELPMRYTLRDFPSGLNELTPLDFASPYGCSKGAADQYVRDWNRNFGLQTVVFRHSSIYGGRQFASYDQGWIGWFCQKAIEQKKIWGNGHTPEPFTISGTGKQVRDVLHAKDLIRLYHSAWQQRDAVAGKIFNIGGGLPNSLSLLELFTLLEKLLKLDITTPLVYTHLPRRQSDQDYFVADISRAKDILGWVPTISAQDGIESMINWVIESGDKHE